MLFEAWILVCEKFTRLQMVSREALHSSTTRALASHFEHGIHGSSPLTLSEKVPYTNVERKYTLITCMYYRGKLKEPLVLSVTFRTVAIYSPHPQDIFGPQKSNTFT